MVGGQQENLCNIKAKILFDSNSERRLKAFANDCNVKYEVFFDK